MEIITQQELDKLWLDIGFTQDYITNKYVYIKLKNNYHILNKGIDELIEKYQTKYDYDNSEYSLPSADYFCFIQDLKKLKGE